MNFLYLKALHIIFMVAWFAALFYMPRLLIYFLEAEQKEELEKSVLQKQLAIMQKRLWYIIAWPGMIITVGIGMAMLYTVPAYLKMPWMHVKLSLIAVLVLYHLATHRHFIKINKKTSSMSSLKMRAWNEIATLLLFAIVFVVVLKDSLSWLYAVLALILLGAVLSLAIKIYNQKRKDH